MFYYTAVMKSRRKIPLSPAAMRQARMTIAVAKIKSLGDSTRDSWYSDRTLKAINMSLEELWDWKYDRWSIYLTKQDQESIMAFLAIQPGWTVSQAERAVTAWKSSKKYLRPDDMRYDEYNLSKISTQLKVTSGFNYKAAEKAHIERTERAGALTRLIEALIQNRRRIELSDPYLGHNLKTLMITLICCGTLGFRVQLTCAPKEHPNKPSKNANYLKWMGGEERGNLRRSYISIWNCRATEDVEFPEPPNQRMSCDAHFRRRDKRRPDKLFDVNLGLVRTQFEQERNNPFDKDVFQYMADTFLSMKFWAQTVPGMRTALERKYWAIFVKVGNTRNFKVRPYQDGDASKILMKLQLWLHRNVGWTIVKGLQIYDARRVQAVTAFCKRNKQYASIGLYHKSSKTVDNYLRSATNAKLLEIHRDFINAVRIRTDESFKSNIFLPHHIWGIKNRRRSNLSSLIL